MKSRIRSDNHVAPHSVRLLLRQGKLFTGVLRVRPLTTATASCIDHSSVVDNSVATATTMSSTPFSAPSLQVFQIVVCSLQCLLCVLWLVRCGQVSYQRPCNVMEEIEKTKQVI